MRVEQGTSHHADATAAVADATATWSEERLDIIIAFVSTRQDAGEVARALKRRYPDARVVGCTTAGEHLNGEHHNGSLVVTGIQSSDLRWSAERVEGLATFDARRAAEVTDRLLERLEVPRSEIDPRKHFALVFIDGLSMAEERVASHLATALEGVPLVGGSAGDDLAFMRTSVILDGGAYSDSAVVVLGESAGGYEILKHQHFDRGHTLLAVTKADPGHRKVHELDGLPAIEAYAAAIGMEVSEVTDDVTFLHPVTFSYNDEIYVRSIQKVEPDGSIVFYCAIEEGMVLEVGRHHDMSEALAGDVATMEEGVGQAELLIACNCILRSREAEKRQVHDRLGGIVGRIAKHSIGFDTYGEQLNGMHINQTLVALALGGRGPEARQS